MSGNNNTRREVLKYGSLTGTAAMTMSLSGCTGGDGGEFPSQTIEIIVPFPEGGAADAYTRNVWAEAADYLDADYQVVNEEGSASLAGTGRGIESEPDGHTLFNHNPPSTPFSALIHEPDFDLREAEGIASVGQIVDIAVANPEIADEYGIDDLEDAIELYEDGTFTDIGSQARGGIKHAIALAMQDQFPWPWENYIGYDGTPPAIEAAASGEVPISFGADGGALGLADEVEVIGALGSDGTDIFPDAPSTTDLGYPDIDYLSVLDVSFYAPPDTPEDRTESLTEAVEYAMDQESVQEWSEESGNPLQFSDGEEAIGHVEEAYSEIPDAVDIDELREEAEG